jgi:hypothetical protein
MTFVFVLKYLDIAPFNPEKIFELQQTFVSLSL